MASGFLHTNFNSSNLVRFLADLAVADTAESRQDVAERVGQWLGVADAITLAAAHSSGNASMVGKRCEARVPLHSAAIDALQGELVQVREALVKAITENCSFYMGGARTISAAKPGAPVETQVDYRPYHRHYLARQRDMDLSIGPLRAKVREVLSTASPTLRQLAILDAAMDEILGVRERESLATVPLLLEKRFEQLSNANLPMLDAAPQPDVPVLAAPRPRDWLAVFRNELQEALLAELDVRLLPVTGLIEALSSEVNQ